MALSRSTMAIDNRRLSNAADQTPETQSGTESASVSPATSASSGSDDEIPDLDLQDDDDDDDDEDGDKFPNGNPAKSSRGANRTRKKGQKFQCTGYGECNLTFTRSEHLSRHIRKHTGEKPYKCFCSRDFSRLDNLRQHAFTVHDPADIPQNWEHNAKGRNKGRKKEVAHRKARLRSKLAVKPEEDSATPPVVTVIPGPEQPIQQQPAPALSKIVSNAPSIQQVQLPQQIQPQIQSKVQPQVQPPRVHIHPHPHQVQIQQQPPQPQPQLQKQPHHQHHHQQQQQQQQQQHQLQHQQQHQLQHQQQQQQQHQLQHQHQQQSQLHPHQQVVAQSHQGQISQHQPIQQQHGLIEHQQKPQVQIHQQVTVEKPPLPRHHQVLPIHTAQSYMYPDAQRQRPRSLHFQSSPLVTESAFHDYRHTTPPHSPASTPQTPQVAPFLYGAASPLGTPTSAVNHHHPLSPGAAGAWGSGSRRQSVHMRAPLRNQAEMEENRLKRATWHAGAEEIVGIVGSMEQANLDDPRPKTRQRASTYIPAATPPDIPIVRPVLEEQTPRTLPPIQPWNFGANPLRLPDKRPGMIGAGREHSRSRSASHILNLSEISAPRGYTDSVAEQRGQRPSLSAQRPRLSVAPRGPNADPNAIFSPALKHARRESFEAVSLPRPMEPHIGSSLLGNRARHSTGNPFSGVPGSDPYKQHRYSSHEGSWDHARMNTIESQVFESRPLEAKAIPLDYLANICTEKIEEDKRQQANHLSSQHSHAKQ